MASSLRGVGTRARRHRRGLGGERPCTRGLVARGGSRRHAPGPPCKLRGTESCWMHRAGCSRCDTCMCKGAHLMPMRWVWPIGRGSHRSAVRTKERRCLPFRSLRAIRSARSISVMPHVHMRCRWNMRRARAATCCVASQIGRRASARRLNRWPLGAAPSTVRCRSPRRRVGV